MSAVTFLGYRPAQIRKAIAGAIAGATGAAVAVLGTAVIDLHIDQGELGAAASAAVVAGLAGFTAVFKTTNGPVKKPQARRAVRRQSADPAANQD